MPVCVCMRACVRACLRVRGWLWYCVHTHVCAGVTECMTAWTFTKSTLFYWVVQIKLQQCLTTVTVLQPTPQHQHYGKLSRRQTVSRRCREKDKQRKQRTLMNTGLPAPIPVHATPFSFPSLSSSAAPLHKAVDSAFSLSDKMNFNWLQIPCGTSIPMLKKKKKKI